MRYILDTHVLLWWLDDSPQLSHSARAVIASKENFVMISAASVWEIRIKQAIGKLELPTNFEEILNSEPFERLSVTVAHAHAVGALPMIHRDPFDRMLIAQARCEGVTLITHDRALAQYDVGVLF